MNNLVARSYEALAVIDDPAERLNQGWLAAIMRDIEAAPRKVEAMHAVVAKYPHRLAFGTLRTTYYAWLKIGDEALVDQRKLKKLGKAHTWVECFMAYCENHNRSNKGAWRIMLCDFWAGKPLPGVGTWREVWRSEYPERAVPPQCPQEWIPAKAKYESLQKHVTKNPDYMFQIAASRQGRKAAHEYLLPVLKTRVGLEVGQVYEFDDQHIDCEVLMPGVGRVARPQEFVGYDIASGFQPVSTVRPQYPEVKGERKNSLKEREFRMMHAYLLTDIGFNPKGVRMIVEHGTTAIRANLEKRIKTIPTYGDLITYARSGILAEAVHAGMFKGDGGGNFRFKGYCEQAHRLEHSVRAALPGQVGQDSDHRPESHAALVRYDQAIMEAVLKLPEADREKVRFNLCDWPTFARLNMMLTDAIYDNPNHRMEGWADRNVVVWRLSDTDCWHGVGELEDMAGDQRAAVLAFLSAHPEHKAVRRMTRREVWHQGVRKFVRIPMFELPLLLDERPIKEGGDARMITVKKNGTFGFTDQFYYGPDAVIHHATCKTRTGFQTALIPEREYVYFGTPLHTEGGVIVDKESGKVIGFAPSYKRAPIYDRDAIVRAAGAQNADLAAKMLPVRGRHQVEAEQRLALIGQNADVLGRRIERPDLTDGEAAPMSELENDKPADDFWQDEEADKVTDFLSVTH